MAALFQVVSGRIRYVILCPATALLLFVSGSALAQSAIYTRVDSFSYSEPVSVKGAVHELSGAFKGGEHALTHNQAELGMRLGNWSLSWLTRYDYDLQFHPDTAELLHHQENDLPVDRGRVYQLDLQARRMRAQGLKLTYAFQPVSNVQGSLALAYLKADQLLDGRMQGDLTTNLDDSYSGDAQLDYVYNEDLLLGRAVTEPEGQGVTVDLSLSWQPTPGWRLGVVSEDLYSQIRWDRAPYTQATVTSSVVTFDANGFIHTQPVLAGFEGYRTHRQHLPVRTTAWIDRAVSERLWLGAELYAWDALLFERLSLTWQGDKGRKIRAMYDIKAGALGISMVRHGVSLSFVSDKLDPQDAHTFSVHVGLTLPLR